MNLIEDNMILYGDLARKIADTSMPIFSQYDSYYWVSMPSISKSKACYWTSKPIISQSKAYYLTSMPITSQSTAYYCTKMPIISQPKVYYFFNDQENKEKENARLMWKSFSASNVECKYWVNNANKWVLSRSN